MSPIRLELSIEASAETVFRAITEPAGIADWWTRDLTGDGCVGSVWTFRFESGAFNKMRVVRSEPGHRVVWECVDGAAEWIGTRVEFRLTGRNQLTRLVFRHADWRGATDYMKESAEHWRNYMNSLRSYCKTGRGSPNPGRPQSGRSEATDAL